MSDTNCLLYVDANGRYCCSDKAFTNGAGSADNAGTTITLVNTGPIDLLIFPTGNTTDPSTVFQTIQPGTTTIFDAGTFKFDFDCEAIHGTLAPTDPALQMMICCKEVSKELNSGNAALLQKLCDIADNTANTRGIETSLAQIGCIKDADNNFVAAVMACKTVDEETLAESFVLKAFYTDGTVVDNYTGPWADCSPPLPYMNLGTVCY